MAWLGVVAPAASPRLAPPHRRFSAAGWLLLLLPLPRRASAVPSEQSCTRISGRLNTRTTGTDWCSGLSTSVAGGCAAWFSHSGDGDGTYYLCGDPTSGSSCAGSATTLSCNTCQGIIGRRNAYTSHSGAYAWCKDTPKTITGGCDAWYAHTSNGVRLGTREPQLPWRPRRAAARWQGLRLTRARLRTCHSRAYLLRTGRHVLLLHGRSIHQLLHAAQPRWHGAHVQLVPGHRGPRRRALTRDAQVVL